MEKEASSPHSMLRPETLERAERGKGLSIQETHELAYEIVRLRGIEEQLQSAEKVIELEEQFETAQAVIREVGATYDGVTPIFRKTGTKLLGADAFTYAPDICEALNAARHCPVAYPAKSPSDA